MKKLIIASLFSVFFFAISCQQKQDEEITPSNLSVSEFEKHGQLLGLNEAESLVTAGKLGDKPENALTPLIFKKGGALITEAEFNNRKVSPDSIEIRYTDLSTFRKTTNRKEAAKEYTKSLLGPKNKLVWIFDPFQTEYLTQTEEKEAVDKAVVKSGPPIQNLRSPNLEYEASVDDIFVTTTRVMPDVSPFGHAAGSYTRTSHSTFQSFMNATGVVEAVGYKEHTKDEVVDQALKVSWSGIGFYHLYPNKLKINSAGIFASLYWIAQSNQDITKYSIFALKNGPILMTNTWGIGIEKSTYCSLLIWQGYYNCYTDAQTKGRLDIDSDGGIFCLPADILRNKKAYFHIIHYKPIN